MKRWLRRIGLALAELVLVSALASLAYNAATSGGVAASKLYTGPYVTVDGTQLAYRRWGTQGSPVVLVGGAIEPTWVWHDVGPLLARTHRVYALDLPPFGYSQRRGPYTLARWTQLVENFDRRLGIHRPVLVGHSLGAAVVVSAATEAPRSVSGIVLLDGDALPGGAAPGFLTHLLLPPWFTSAYRIATSWNWIFRKGLRSAWGPAPPAFTNAFVDEWKRPFRVSGTASAFTSMLAHGIQGVSTATLARVHVPALVAWGSDDTVDSVSAGRRTASIMHAPFVEIPGSGHLSMLARPAPVARAIERLFRRS
ncbi:MAG TPA: alpha/beta hydrolase [Gaiellaceae bacterium]